MSIIDENKPALENILRDMTNWLCNNKLNKNTKYQRVRNLLNTLCDEYFPYNKEFNYGMMWFNIYEFSLKPIKNKKDCCEYLASLMKLHLMNYGSCHYTVYKDLHIGMPYQQHLPLYTVPNVDSTPEDICILMVSVPCLGYLCLDLPMGKYLKIKTRMHFTWKDLEGLTKASLASMSKLYVGEHMDMLKRMIQADHILFSRYPMWMPYGPWKELINTMEGSPRFIDTIGGDMIVYAVMFMFDGEWVAPVYGLRRCEGCGKEELSGRDREVRLLVCAGCERSYYCSRECQKAAWQAHKPMCEKRKN